VIELLLQAERSLTVGQLDAAERLYWQAIENDPQNSMAVVGLARVALDRGDERGAYQFARKALEIDAENSAAQRMVSRLGEVMRYRGEQVPTEPTPTLKGRRTHGGARPTGSGARPDETSARPTDASGSAPQTGASASPPKRRGLFGRILGR
jgi:tetratricopeptide (TPR) repeat protein